MFKLLVSLLLISAMSTSTLSLFAQGNFDVTNPCLNKVKVTSEA